MIDFNNTVIRFDDERRPYYTARGAKGKFERVYLNEAEQQAHKEWDAARTAKLNEAVPARGQTKSVQHIDTAPYDRSSARNATLATAYATGTVCNGPCPTDVAVTIIPQSIAFVADNEVVTDAQAVVRRTVSLIDSMADLSTALYNFGAIETNEIANLRDLIESYDPESEIGEEEDSDNGLVSAYAFVRRIAYNMHTAYTTPRTSAPTKVVGYHAAPVVTLLQYLMGLTFPNGDMAVRAQQCGLMYRYNDSLADLVLDFGTVYNNIQADLSEAGLQLMGEVPAEIGEIGLREDMSLIDNVRAADEMISYLVSRVDDLTGRLTAHL